MKKKKKKSSEKKTAEEHNPAAHTPQNIERSITYVLLSGCLLFVLWVIWSVEISPLQDLPDHAGRAEIIRSYLFDSFLQKHFRPVIFPLPYFLPDIWLALLLSVFSVQAAVKLFATFACLAVLGGAYYFIRNVCGNRLFLLFLPFVILFSKVYAKGNLNFLYGLGLLYFMTGYWWPRRRNCPRNTILILNGLGFLLYLTHFVDLFAWVFITGISLLWEWKNTRKIPLKNSTILVTPLIMMTAYFLWDGAGAGNAPLKLSDIFALKNIGTKPGNIKEMFTFTAASDWLVFLPGGLFFAGTVFLCLRDRLNTSKEIKEKALIFFGLLFWVLISPYHLPDLIRVYERFFLVFLVWSLCLTEWPETLRRKIKYIWMAVMILTLFVWGNRFQKFGKYTENFTIPYYQALKSIPENSLVYPLKYGRTYLGTIGTLVHFDKYGAAEKRIIFPNQFITKFICIRYRNKMPVPPEGQVPIITREMLNFYDYFIVYGSNPMIADLVKHGFLSRHWGGSWLTVYKNMGKTIPAGQ